MQQTLQDSITYDYICDMADNPWFGADMLNIMLCNPVAFPTMSIAAVKWFMLEYEPYGDDLWDTHTQLLKARKQTTKEQQVWYDRALDYYENQIHFYRTGEIGF